MSQVITLITDFGVTDPYAGMIKGVILSIHPAARLIDVTHQVPHQDIRQGAYILGTAYRYFPAGTVHLVVVDPGVGSDRRGIAVRTERGLFVAPDNGLLSYVLGKETVLEAVDLRNSGYWLTPVSATFHGRDIFAPVAAHISRGVPLSAFGPPAGSLQTFTVPSPHVDVHGNITGQVIHVDRYGNLVTNISWREKDTKQDYHLCIGRRSMLATHHTFASVPPGEVVVYVGSNETLEIAVRNGNAARTLDVSIGSEVTVFRSGQRGRSRATNHENRGASSV